MEDFESEKPGRREGEIAENLRANVARKRLRNTPRNNAGAIAAGAAAAVFAVCAGSEAKAEFGPLQPVAEVGGDTQFSGLRADGSKILWKKFVGNQTVPPFGPMYDLHEAPFAVVNDALQIQTPSTVLWRETNTRNFADTPDYWFYIGGPTRRDKTTGVEDNFFSSGNPSCITRAGDFMVTSDFFEAGAEAVPIDQAPPVWQGRVELSEFAHPDKLSECVAYSPDGKNAAVQLFEGVNVRSRIELWDCEGNENAPSNRPPVCSNSRAIFTEHANQNLSNPHWVYPPQLPDGRFLRFLAVNVNDNVGHGYGGAMMAASEDITVQVQDSDGDGFPDIVDNCPADPNEGQEDSDEDEAGNACDDFPNDSRNDEDDDGFGADVDNCPVRANSGQENLDGDEQGDACDFDKDGDGQVDMDEQAACETDECRECVTNTPHLLDSNADDIADVCNTASELGYEQESSEAPGVFFKGNVSFETKEDGKIHAVVGLDPQNETKIMVTQGHAENFTAVEIPPQEGPTEAPEGFDWTKNIHIEVLEGKVCDQTVVDAENCVEAGNEVSRTRRTSEWDVDGIEGTAFVETVSPPRLERVEVSGGNDGGDGGGNIPEDGGRADAGEDFDDGGEATDAADDGGFGEDRNDVGFPADASDGGGDTETFDANNSPDVHNTPPDAHGFDAGADASDGGTITEDKTPEKSGCGGCASSPKEGLNGAPVAMLPLLFSRRLRRVFSQVSLRATKGSEAISSI